MVSQILTLDFIITTPIYSIIVTKVQDYDSLSIVDKLKLYDLTPKEKTDDAFYANHYWYEPLAHPVSTVLSVTTPGAPQLLFIFYVYFIYLMFSDPITWLFGKFFKSLMLEDIKIQENIDDYVNCLDDDDKKWTI